MPGGRPTAYSLELAKKICDLTAQSAKSLASVAIEVGIPYGTIREWLSTHEEFSAIYAKAKQDQADFLFEELIEIADDKSGDLLETETGYTANNANVNRSKLQVDTRKWVAARLNARKYGEKSEVNQTSTVTNITVSKEEAADIKKSLENDI